MIKWNIVHFWKWLEPRGQAVKQYMQNGDYANTFAFPTCVHLFVSDYFIITISHGHIVCSSVYTFVVFLSYRCPSYLTVVSMMSFVQKNKIEVLKMSSSRRLVYLDASHNHLMNIHGLDGCTSLRHLDLSHNRITRVGKHCCALGAVSYIETYLWQLCLIYCISLLCWLIWLLVFWGINLWQSAIEYNVLSDLTVTNIVRVQKEKSVVHKALAFCITMLMCGCKKNGTAKLPTSYRHSFLCHLSFGVLKNVHIFYSFDPTKFIITYASSYPWLSWKRGHKVVW